VAVTLDDGPNHHTTPRVLQILAEADVQATFFILGREAQKYPQIVRRIAASGHEIGIHGFNHSSKDIRGQIFECERVLRECNVSSRLFRPPRGVLGNFNLLLRPWKYSMVIWSVDVHDSMRHEGKWLGPEPDYSRVTAGDIVLMHDDNPVCVDDLPRLIESLRAKNLIPVTVSELLAGKKTTDHGGERVEKE